MKYIQILECSSTLGNCCNDYALVTIIDITRKILELVQLVVPILLIVMITVQLVKMVVSPDDKKDMKKLANKIIALFVCFFLPIIVDVVVGLLPNNFKLSSCWENAKISREISANTPLVYISVTDRDPYSVVGGESGYEPGNEKVPGSPGSSSISGAGAQRLLNVAVAEIGIHESNGGHTKYGLGSSLPWCAAFVAWCANQTGFASTGVLPNFTYCSANASWFQQRGRLYLEDSGYMPQPGDIIFFGAGGSQHMGIVEKADERYVYTIEGNTSCEGSASSVCGGSDGVSRKTRSRHTGYIYAYGNPAY